MARAQKLPPSGTELTGMTGSACTSLGLSQYSQAIWILFAVGGRPWVERLIYGARPFVRLLIRRTQYSQAIWMFLCSRRQAVG